MRRFRPNRTDGSVFITGLENKTKAEFEPHEKNEQIDRKLSRNRLS